MSELFIADKGGLFRNRKFTDIKKSDFPDVADLIHPSLSIRNSVNKEIGRKNTQEWNVEITAFDPRDLQLLQVNFWFFEYWCLYFFLNNYVDRCYN
jgi:hypothetical protein